MDFKGILSAFVVTLPLTLGGCAASSTQPGDVIDETQESASALRKYHYEPSVQGLRWAPGCGVVRPDGTGCPVGFVLTYTKSYFDLQTTITHRTDDKKHTITITLDTWSTGTVHSMIAVRPQDELLGSLEAQVGHTYHVTVEDRHHHELWSGDATPVYAY
jgi:hypothetical protein